MNRLNRLSARERRVIAVGVVTVAVAVGWTLVIGPQIQRAGDMASRLQRERALLREELALVATAKDYADAYETGAERLLAAAPRFLSGETSGAVLQAYVTSLVEDRPIYIASMGPVRADTSGAALTRFSLAVRGESDLEGVLTLLSLLERGPKLVQVRGLQLNVPGAADLKRPERIDFSFALIGFALRDTAGDTLFDRAET